MKHYQDKNIQVVSKRKNFVRGQIHVHPRKRYVGDKLESDLISILSHDIGGPLNLINFWLQKIREDGSRQSAENLIEFINEITDSTIELERMLNEFISWVKFQEGCLEPVFTPVNLYELVQEKINLYKGLMVKGVSMSNEIKPGVVIITDKIMLGIIIQNLLGNAVKHTQKGAIDIQCQHTEKFTKIEIRDSGNGIAFSGPNYFIENTKNEDKNFSHGSGLGLKIVRQLVELLGGNLQITSKLKKGTTIIINLKN